MRADVERRTYGLPPVRVLLKHPGLVSNSLGIRNVDWGAPKLPLLWVLNVNRREAFSSLLLWYQRAAVSNGGDTWRILPCAQQLQIYRTILAILGCLLAAQASCRTHHCYSVVEVEVKLYYNVGLQSMSKFRPLLQAASQH